MRTIIMLAAGALAAGIPPDVRAQDAFDACEVFTQSEARRVLGAVSEAEPVNPKARKPKVVPTCTWWSSKDGRSVSASATFRFARTDTEAQRAFDDEKLRFQTKPMLIGGASAFWSAKQGSLHLLKGRTWLVVSVGGAKPGERDADAARKVAESLEKKL